MKQVLVPIANKFFIRLLRRFSSKQVISSTRHQFVLVLISIATLAGCQKSTHKQTVALKAEFETVSTILQEGPPELDSIAGQGYGTPIGKSSFNAHAKFDDSGNLTGKIIATSSNGDEFFATIKGTAPDIDDNGSIILHFESVITGGTGKFSGATGSFSGVARESIYNAAGSASWDGAITY